MNLEPIISQIATPYEARGLHGKGLLLTSVIWLLVLLTVLVVGVMRGFDAQILLPYALAAAVPAVLGIAMTPVLHREWAQILVIFGWLALAIIACITLAFWPMVVLFLCAPAAAALFEREKIIEALFLAAIFAALIYYAGRTGFLPDTATSETSALWTRLAAPIGTVAFTFATLFAASHSRRVASLSPIAATIPANRGEQDTAMLDALAGGIVRINGDDDITFVSMDAYDIFELPEDSGHLSVHALLNTKHAERAQILDLIERARTSGDTESVTLRFGQNGNDKKGGDDPEGAARSVIDLRATPLTDGEVVLHGVDETARESRISALNTDWVSAHQSVSTARQDMEDKNLFFSGVSHELRTPLNAIIGFSDMMRSRLFGPLPGKYAEYADLIHDSGQHMLDLIGDVLDMSKVEAGKYELLYGVFDMADVVRSSVKMVRPSADAAEIKLSTDVGSDGDMLIEADRKAVRQMILNLLSNAIKFTPKGGSVDIASRVVGDTMHLSVTDNGAGMTPDELSKVGQPYAQGASAQMSEQRGSGLGLSLVKSLTDLHGGRFVISSQPNQGTSVDIYLPLSKD